MQNTTIHNGNGMDIQDCSFHELFFGADLSRFHFPRLLLQISVASTLSALFNIVLKPLGTPEFVPQMLSGILVGPSFLGYTLTVSPEFYTRSLYIFETYESFCFMFVAFLATAQVDIGMIKKGGKLALINGFLLFIVPWTFGLITDHIVRYKIHLPSPNLHSGLYNMAILESTAYFQVIYGVLSDLKMLNSELGRLALSSLMISNGFGWLTFLISTGVKRSLKTKDLKHGVGSQMSMLLLMLAIIFICRPIMLWVMKRTPGGQKLKESHLCAICIMLLLCAFIGDTIGFTFIAGVVILGMATPSRLPLGPGLSDKIGCFVWIVLMPCYVNGIASRVNVFAFYAKDLLISEMVILVIQSAKFASIFIPSFYFKVPLSQAATLGFIVNIRGIFDIQTYKQSMNYRGMATETFSIMVISAMVHSTIYTMIVRRLYQPPTYKYIAYHRLTVEHLQPESPLTILTCFHELEAVVPLLSLLEISCPSRESPISISVMNLEELQSNTIPVFIHHRLDRRRYTELSSRDQIVNAFRSYKNQNQGLVSVDCFTVVAPYTMIHEDVCSMALDKRAEIVIMPLDNDDELQARRICQNILEMAPCSVAIYLDRGKLPDVRSILIRRLIVNVCAIFIGGADDREALALATRMSNHPSVSVHVIRLVINETLWPLNDLIDKRLDSKAIRRFRTGSANREKVKYVEQRIEGADDLINMLKEHGDEYDLIIAGIKHDKDNSIVRGLSAWSEMKELGVIGDLVASRDLGLTPSVLAVQQQSLEADMVGSSSPS